MKKLSVEDFEKYLKISSKPSIIKDIKLDPKMPVGQALSILLYYLYIMMTREEKGVLKNEDPEFLHRFRVSLRRVRTLVNEMKEVFDQTETAHFKKGLTQVAKATNKKRDIDVFIQKTHSIIPSLPDRCRYGYKEFLKELYFLEKEEFEKLKNIISGREFSSFKKDYEEMIFGKKLIKRDMKNIPVSKIVHKHIKKRYGKILKMKKKLQSFNENDFHKLRIECKKLRYLLEFFHSILSTKKTKRLISRLKGIQDILGEYNDMNIEYNLLCDILKNPHFLKKEGLVTAGCLLCYMQKRKEELKISFKKEFADFVAKTGKEKDMIRKISYR
ncbi:CHAD domain-containing protein [Nitrosophilus alvini]|uniref:CHAD domain-containing protein n=1 Tax=Nitrosophilus alvini TaxID=2714855 RepID=UPI001909A1F0|nr:CHAD domain-containing protein [Nitrosophilus alvini]